MLRLLKHLSALIFRSFRSRRNLLLKNLARRQQARCWETSASAAMDFWIHLGDVAARMVGIEVPMRCLHHSCPSRVRRED